MLDRPKQQDGWTRVRFDQLATQINDRVDNPAEAGVERYVGLEHLDTDSLRIRRWGKPTDVESTKLRFQPGDIIFGKRRVYQRKLAVADSEGICSAHAMVLRAKPGAVLPDFLPFFMQSDLFMERALSISVGSLSPTINWSTLATEEFLLPPISEQAQLVEALTAANKLADAQQNLRSNAEAVFKGLLKERIGRGFKPADYQGWEDNQESGIRCVTLSSVASVDRGKFSHRPRNLPQFFGGPYPFAQTGDVAAARGRDFRASQFLSDEGVQYSKSFPKGTIFLTIAAVIAATAISTSETWCTDSVVGIVPNDPTDLDYLEYALRFTRPYLEYEVATQTAQKNINLEVLRPLTIPWPEKAERRAITDEIAIVEGALRTVEARQSSIRRLIHEMLRANFEVAP